MSPNRIIALVTPVAALAAGACATWLAQHFPGIDIKQGDLQSVFIAGAVVVLAPAAQWLHGWQKHEAREADTANTIKLGALAVGPAVAAAGNGAAQADDLSGVDDLAELDAIDDVDHLSALGDLDGELLDEDELAQTAG